MGVSLVPPAQYTRDGAALLALLTEEYGPLPLGLAEAQSFRTARPQPDIAPLSTEVVGTLLLKKAVVELTSLPGAGATSLAMRLAAQAIYEEPARWIGVVDPSGSLCAPSMLALGVPLTRSLVVQPHDVDDVMRLGVRLARWSCPVKPDRRC